MEGGAAVVAWARRLSRAERPRGSVAAYLRTIYIVLISIVVLSVLAEVLFREVDLIDRFAPNIATESMGILLVVLFVQRYLERQERAQRLRASIGGLRKASRALQRMAETWAELVKGTLPREPESPPRALGDLLETHYTEQLAHCDPGPRAIDPGPCRSRGCAGRAGKWRRRAVS